MLCAFQPPSSQPTTHPASQPSWGYNTGSKRRNLKHIKVILFKNDYVFFNVFDLGGRKHCKNACFALSRQPTCQPANQPASQPTSQPGGITQDLKEKAKKTSKSKLFKMLMCVFRCVRPGKAKTIQKNMLCAFHSASQPVSQLASQPPSQPGGITQVLKKQKQII